MSFSLGAALAAARLDMIASLQSLTSAHPPKATPYDASPHVRPPSRPSPSRADAGCALPRLTPCIHECAVSRRKADIRFGRPVEPRLATVLAARTPRLRGRSQSKSKPPGRTARFRAAASLFAKLAPLARRGRPGLTSRSSFSRRRRKAPSPPSYGCGDCESGTGCASRPAGGHGGDLLRGNNPPPLSPIRTVDHHHSQLCGRLATPFPACGWQRRQQRRCQQFFSSASPAQRTPRPHNVRDNLRDDRVGPPTGSRLASFLTRVSTASAGTQQVDGKRRHTRHRAT